MLSSLRQFSLALFGCLSAPAPAQLQQYRNSLTTDICCLGTTYYISLYVHERDAVIPPKTIQLQIMSQINVVHARIDQSYSTTEVYIGNDVLFFFCFYCFSYAAAWRNKDIPVSISKPKQHPGLPTGVTNPELDTVRFALKHVLRVIVLVRVNQQYTVRPIHTAYTDIQFKSIKRSKTWQI